MDLLELNWKKTRSGAWAGRGFHYQHLFTVLILIRQWAGLAPIGFVIPEGLEDCVIQLHDRTIWIQIKSRNDGSFGRHEVATILEGVRQKTSKLKCKNELHIALGLERPCQGISLYGLDQLFENPKEPIFVCRHPEKEIVYLLKEKLNTADVIAEGIASDLYKFVADTSATNASVSYKDRKRISTTDVERRVFERLEAEDPSCIDQAVTSGALEPIDFMNPINEPGFYQGVKTQPGHVAAGLVFKRSQETEAIVNLIRKRRQLLISGPSGSGKSSLSCLVAHALAQECRCFNITSMAGPKEADSIVRFIRSRRPSEMSPILIVMDEVKRSNCNLWDILARELSQLQRVYLLGSIRNEDLNLLVSHSDVEIVESKLDEKLAERIWQGLRSKLQTNWTHWREPFEKSEGLMLEYVHLLTQGKRLESLIRDQVREREKEGREDELAIIRATSVLCSYGGELNAQALFATLGIAPENASIALKRLLNEHLVRESRPGVLGGLHALRSSALSIASHDELSFRQEDSIWLAISAVPPETLPQIVHSILRDHERFPRQDVLWKLANILANDKSVDLWVAVLTGLGLATIEDSVNLFIESLENNNVQRAQWSFASMFADTDIELPDLNEFHQWGRIRKGVHEFRQVPKYDYRHECVALFPPGMKFPECRTLDKANQLLSCLVPIFGGEQVHLPLNCLHNFEGEPDISKVAKLLSTAFLISPDFADDLVNKFGGEKTLLSWFHSQIPWLAKPVVEEDGSHGRTVRANWYLVSDDYQTDPHEMVKNICEMLIAISPSSQAAACEAIDVLGEPIRVGDFSPWSKNMPRKNIPAKTRIAWNVAFRQILLTKSRTRSLTDYAQQMAALVKRTEKVFGKITENWIRGNTIVSATDLINEIDSIIKQVNTLAFSTTPPLPGNMSFPNIEASEEDSMGALLSGILGNLVPRILKFPAEKGTKGAAEFAGSLASDAISQIKSSVWRTINKSPKSELEMLANRLRHLSHILHEMAANDSEFFTNSLLKRAIKHKHGKGFSSVGKFCHSRAEQRFVDKLRTLKRQLKNNGWAVKCFSRLIEEWDSFYWPPKEIAILIEISDFETQADYIGSTISAAQEILGTEWKFCVVPLVNGYIVPSLALRPVKELIIPDENFLDNWHLHIDLPCLNPEISDSFDNAVRACKEVSAIVASRDLSHLHKEEANAFDEAQGAFERNHRIIKKCCEEYEKEEFIWALNHIEELWEKVRVEFESAKAGQKVSTPICADDFRALAGAESEQINQLAGARLLLRQAEATMAT
ncbi:hypothetical protein [Candidatus Nitronereus thalassa]|uniref:AAA+ ATPase domain-containing protein n=1 Tax=Candidatus Nitronereus thalassa TaxID=3020898 RepID=A0ABU3KB69_9BACT|nr:hypothetical protein [Candidatus Nitronereus thalassa]MDT7043668.1 hypothetical protein [Candidatus Nitronereus thalassa]